MTIQCCSHTFCEECIRFELIIKGQCPVCRSTKCGVEDLIPNVSLNETVKRILEPQLVVDARKNDLPKYASDEGSGIEGNNISYVVPVTKRNKGLFNYTSAEDQGSNLDKVEYAYTLQNGKAPITTAAKSQDINQPLIMPQDYMPLQGGDGPFTVGSTNKKVTPFLDNACFL
ncbi:DWNN domain-containing protein [Tanacetum coccineum]